MPVNVTVQQSSCCSDGMKLALSIALPNLASMAGCAAVGKCSFTSCCKATGKGDHECPVPSGLWHGALFASNCATGYASYLVWKELRGLGGHEHGMVALLLLSNVAHPTLLSKVDQYGIGPAAVNSLVGLAAAGFGIYLFHQVDKQACGFLLPGFALALMRFACTVSCAGKKGCGPCGGGASCPPGAKPAAK